MTNLKGDIHAMIFIATAIVGISSCAQMAAEPEQRLHGKFDNYGGVGAKPTYYLTFSEPHTISRIVIHTQGVIKNVEVYVRTEKGWRLVKHIMTPINAGTRINIGMTGDAIRVAQKTATRRGFNIRDIEAFGYSKK